MSPFAVPQSTADRWRADGRFVLFGEGERWPHSKFCILCASGEHHTPPAAMIEAAKLCETCGGFGLLRAGSVHPKCWGGQPAPCVTICPDCSNGQRRHPVTVPCDGLGGEHRQGPCPNDGRISTGLLAVVEWGPLEVIGQTDEPRPIQGAFDRSFITLRHHNGKPFLVRFAQGQRGEGEVLTLPPDVDPASLVGQWAIGGRIEVAG